MGFAGRSGLVVGEVRKAVIPAAGLGTRFLPATKVQPKEMLPIIDTPTIQYVIEEVVESGITDILIITGKGKRSIEDHFDRSWELEQALEEAENKKLLEYIQRISNLAEIHYIRQKVSNGLGDAIHYAKQHVAGEPFVVLLGDTIVSSPGDPCTRQLMDFYRKWRCPVIGVEQVPRDKVVNYGIIDGKTIDDRTLMVRDLIEKPDVDSAPSTYAVGGRYILTADIFDYIEHTPPGKKNEIQLTDALRLMAKDQTIYAYEFEGKRHDIGNRLDYLKTSVEFALRREDLRDEFLAFLKEEVPHIIEETQPADKKIKAIADEDGYTGLKH
ncbi:MAG: UTP--glucose-1-phosphate uridylyltransferase GalU [bacterium]|jgi:UTP--glucose-1-phosphate uridylyltransferase|nr:UTP--glucose-1-phosphate uridylyltransferase GalU [bacterium]